MGTKERIQDEVSAKIAARNDAVRMNAANYMATRGIMSLEPAIIGDIFIAVQKFSDFTDDNDPYDEHDFGSFVCHSNRVFWKIDYYTNDLSGGCDPLDPNCRRVLTIMLAEEY